MSVHQDWNCLADCSKASLLSLKWNPVTVSNMTTERVIRSTYLHTQKNSYGAKLTPRGVKCYRTYNTADTLELNLWSGNGFRTGRDSSFTLQSELFEEKRCGCYSPLWRAWYFLIVHWCWLWLTTGNVSCVVNIAWQEFQVSPRQMPDWRANNYVQKLTYREERRGRKVKGGML